MKFALCKFGIHSGANWFCSSRIVGLFACFLHYVGREKTPDIESVYCFKAYHESDNHECLRDGDFEFKLVALYLNIKEHKSAIKDFALVLQSSLCHTFLILQIQAFPAYHFSIGDIAARGMSIQNTSV